MQILAIENRPIDGKGWSFSLTSRPIWQEIEKQGCSIVHIGFESFYGLKAKKLLEESDLIFYQNANLINPGLFAPSKSIIRIGSIQPLNTGIIKSCKAVIVTNGALLSSISNISKNLFLIPNSLDLKEWGFIEDAPEKFTVGYVGWHGLERYKQQKGFDLVRQACDKAEVNLKTATYPDTLYPHDRMHDLFYRNISCLVMPSITEGCNNSIMEALACGKPVIITKVGYHGENLRDGVDCLFTMRDVGIMAQMIKKLKQDKGLYDNLRKNGRVFAENNHNFTVIVNQYMEIFGIKAGINSHFQETINWLSGNQGYAHNIKVERLTKLLPEYRHIENRIQANNQITVAMSPGQLKSMRITDKAKTIFHLCTPRELDPIWMAKKKLLLAGYAAMMIGLLRILWKQYQGFCPTTQSKIKKAISRYFSNLGVIMGYPAREYADLTDIEFMTRSVIL